MVVGSGMMARAFAAFRDVRDVLIFASGVSNSTAGDASAFLRERRLLEQTRSEYPDPLLVYFGTCSVDDPDRAGTHYVRHKLAMESLVASGGGSWLTLRLHLAIGRQGSPTTFAQFLHDRIVNGEPFEVWSRAVRYPIDVDDVVRMATCMIGEKMYRNRIVNIALRRYSALEVVQSMERALDRAARFTVVEKGRPFELSCPEVEAIADQLDLDYSKGYLDRVLRKYFGR